MSAPDTVLKNATTIDQLPQVTSWPKDGGAFVTLPEVYTEDPDRPGFARGRTWACTGFNSRAAIYVPNREVGLHYQIHRSIGVHHAAAIRRGERLRVNVFVGGTPAMMLAAVMPSAGRTLGTGFCRGLGRSSHSDGDAAR